MKRLVIGILAHVDAGKTTLSEGLLYHTGDIRRQGRVDHGDAFLDTHSIERDRGITIFSKQAILHPDGWEITLLDTPGHVDFSTEAERTLNVLDYAILVVSAVDGVQLHTETIWRLLRRYKVPVFVFINKMDISQRDCHSLLSELNSRLDSGFVDFGCSDREQLYDFLAMCDENIMEQFLEDGFVSPDNISRVISERKVFPCIFGSALKMQGVGIFLELITKYAVQPQYGKEFGAKIFKITEDAHGGRLTHMKITGGVLKVRDEVHSADAGEKVSQLRIYSGAKYKTVDQAPAGVVCAVAGLTSFSAGEGLGFEKDAALPVLEPVLSYNVILLDSTDPNTALKNFRILEEEDPQLHVSWNGDLREISLRLMGAVQLEVLSRLVKERFGMDIAFGKGAIAYKETIADVSIGIGHYEPLRHYAEVHLLMEPGAPGSGLVFTSECNEDDLDRNWQRLILTHLKEKQHIGVLTGSPITDMKISVIAGRAHKKHTEGGDFRQATYRAVRQGLRCAKSVLLEPWYSFRLEIPAENVGKAMNDLMQMGGSFSQPDISGDSAVIKGRAPVSCMQDYMDSVTTYTHGKGRLSCLPDGYSPCHNSDEVISKIGYSCDADPENTADSVFCSGGAGFNVRWDQVKNYAHVDSGYSFGAQPEPKKQRLREMAQDYVSRAAMDAELIKIFERTYGPIKRDMNYAMETRREPSSAPKYKAKTNIYEKEYLLVDGYNIIFAWDKLKRLAEDSLDAARTALVETLSNYKGFCGIEIIVVFDAYRVKGAVREVEHIGSIDVVYTKEAETADMYIEKVTHDLSKNNRVRVATSDGLEQIIILGGGAVRVSARELMEEIQLAEAAIREILQQNALDRPVERIKIPDEK